MGRDMNDLVRDTKEFNDNFEYVIEKYDNYRYKTDRTIMWAEDMKYLAETNRQGYDDYLRLAQTLKTQKRELQKAVDEHILEYGKAEEYQNLYERKRKSDLKNISRYSGNIKGSLTPQSAQIETAKNTKDLVAQIAQLNLKITDLNTQIASIHKKQSSSEARKKKKELEKLAFWNQGNEDE
jgi:uncharacterized coiled-coil DUF342 family protein